MKPTIIVADDSLTIQKVIKITLANEDLEIVECLEDHKLIDLCKKVSPTLVLLDFNLSETKTGYDLVGELKAAGVAKVLMLYGTFDTVDENLLAHSRTNDHIVKPFEGSKFITICRQLLEDAKSPEMEQAPIEIEKEAAPVNVEDQWVVNQPKNLQRDNEEKTDEHDMEALLKSVPTNTLTEKPNDWGVDIPSIIDQPLEASSIELPPIIGSVESDLEVDDTILPVDDDLEYPDVEKIKEDVHNSTPKLTPMFELSDVPVGKEYELNDTIGTKTDAEIEALEELIASETTEDLWSIDEGEEVENIAEEIAVNSLEASVSREEVMATLEKKIEEIVNQRVEAILEKVAWEVIPELAENLITKEIKHLSDSVKDS